MANQKSVQDPPLLNPFPFSFDTNYRLILLVLTVIASTTAIGLHVGMQDSSKFEAVNACVQKIMQNRGENSSVKTSDDVYQTLEIIRNESLVCYELFPVDHLFFWIYLFSSLIIGVSIILFITDVRRIKSQYKLKTLPSSIDKTMRCCITDISNHINVKIHPQIYCVPLAPGSNAFVFGSNSNPCLALTFGILQEQAKNSLAAKTIITHEIAHIANGDITQERIVRSIYLSFLLSILPLYVILMFAFQDSRVTYLETTFAIFRVGLAFAIVTLARNAVLRNRERLADLRASFISEVRDGLREDFDRRAENISYPSWFDFTSKHPHPIKRLQGLKSTSDIFGVPFISAVAYGFVIFLITQIFTMLICLTFTDVLLGILSSGSIFMIALITFGPHVPLSFLVTGALITSQWRASFGRLLLGLSPEVALFPAMGMTIGITVSMLTAIVGASVYLGISSKEWQFESQANRFALLLITMPIILGFFYIYFFWIGRVAAAWGPGIVRHPEGARCLPWLIFFTGLPLALILPILLTSVLTVFSLADQIAALPNFSSAALVGAAFLSTLGALTFNPFMPAAFIAIAILPLAARFMCHKFGATPAAWPLLQGQMRDLPEPRIYPIGVGVSGLFFGVLLVVLGYHTDLFSKLSSDLVGPTAPLIFFVLLAAVPAFLASIIVPAFRMEHGFFAGMVSTIAVIITFNYIAGGVPFKILLLIFTFSFLCSLLFSLAGNTFGAIFRAIYLMLNINRKK